MNFEQPRSRSACRSSTDDDVHLPCLFLLRLPSVSISLRIYNSIWNLHSLLIQCFIGSTAVLDAIFTKAISIILKSNFLHSLLIWSLVCFGPLWPYLARFGAVTPGRILPMHLCRSWVRPVQLPRPKKKKQKKNLGSCEGYRIQKWLSATPHVNWNYVSPSVTRKESPIHTHRAMQAHTHHAEVVEMTNFPLCVCAFRAAMWRRSMHLEHQFISNVVVMKRIWRKWGHQGQCFHVLLDVILPFSFFVCVNLYYLDLWLISNCLHCFQIDDFTEFSRLCLFSSPLQPGPHNGCACVKLQYITHLPHQFYKTMRHMQYINQFLSKLSPPYLCYTYAHTNYLI